jgi:hypothetical protein
MQVFSMACSQLAEPFRVFDWMQCEPIIRAELLNKLNFCLYNCYPNENAFLPISGIFRIKHLRYAIVFKARYPKKDQI